MINHTINHMIFLTRRMTRQIVRERCFSGGRFWGMMNGAALKNNVGVNKKQSMISLDFIGLLVMMAGFIIGLGSVIVIDIHGLLGRKSPYWTEATIRTHKVTKPLIWVGIGLAIVGGVLLYREESLSGIPLYHGIIAGLLIVNGLFLSLYVSPLLLRREKEGRQTELLPASLQTKIAASLLVSDIGWWIGVVLLAWYLTRQGWLS